MARGLQKQQAQAKSKAKEAANKGGNSTLKVDKGLKASEKFKCPKCMLDIDSLSNLKLHFTSKHPKDPEPDYEACKKA